MPPLSTPSFPTSSLARGSVTTSSSSSATDNKQEQNPALQPLTRKKSLNKNNSNNSLVQGYLTFENGSNRVNLAQKDASEDLNLPSLEELEAFAGHCRVFYRCSTQSAAIGSKSRNEEDVVTSRAVLEALDACCELQKQQHLQQNQQGSQRQLAQVNPLKDLCTKYKSPTQLQQQLRTCGLLQLEKLLQNSATKTTYTATSKPSNQDVDPASRWILCYIQVRDQQRRFIHAEQMQQRQSALLDFLQKQVDRNQPPQSPTQLNQQQQQKQDQHEAREWLEDSKDALHRFTKLYTSQIGSHAFLAGLRALLERQVSTPHHVCKWSLDAAILTENCAGVGGDGSGFAKDAILMLVTVLVYCPPLPTQDADTVNNDSTTQDNQATSQAALFLSWKIPPFATQNHLKQLLRILPASTKLHARPTGRIQETKEMRRQNGGGRKHGLLSDGRDLLCGDGCHVS